MFSNGSNFLLPPSKNFSTARENCFISWWFKIKSAAIDVDESTDIVPRKKTVNAEKKKMKKCENCTKLMMKIHITSTPSLEWTEINLKIYLSLFQEFKHTPKGMIFIFFKIHFDIL